MFSEGGIFVYLFESGRKVVVTVLVGWRICGPYSMAAPVESHPCQYSDLETSRLGNSKGILFVDFSESGRCEVVTVLWLPF